MWMESHMHMIHTHTCGLAWSVSLTKYNVYQVHPPCGMCRYFIPFMAGQHSIVQTCHVGLSTHLVVGTSAIASRLLWTGMHKYLNTCFLITLDRHLGVELQGHRVIRCLTLRRTAKVLPSFNQEVESQQGHSSVDWDLKPSRLAPGCLFSTKLSCSWGDHPWLAHSSLCTVLGKASVESTEDDRQALLTSRNQLYHSWAISGFPSFW